MAKKTTNNHRRAAKDARETYGGLWVNRKKTKKKSPVLLGEIEFSQTQLDYLDERIDNGDKAVLKLAAWKNIAEDSREEYLTLEAEIPWDSPHHEPQHDSRDDDRPLDFIDS